jgi:hypothetical protein
MYRFNLERSASLEGKLRNRRCSSIRTTRIVKIIFTVSHQRQIPSLSQERDLHAWGKAIMCSFLILYEYIRIHYIGLPHVRHACLRCVVDNGQL